jgi:hypothetical protein
VELLAEVPAVIRPQDEDGVVAMRAGLERLDEAPYALVGCR